MPVDLASATIDGRADRRRLTVTVLHYYDVVVDGVTRMFEGYADRVAVVDEPGAPADIVLYDAFARPDTDHRDFRRLVESDRTAHTVVYAWNFDERVVAGALDAGVRGYLSKAKTARELVVALERIARGQLVVSSPPRPGRLTVGLDWPGRVEGLSEREAEVLALIVQGYSNLGIAHRLFLSPNTVKTYIRSAYRKIGARRRVGAVLWGMEHGFAPGRDRIHEWSMAPMPSPPRDDVSRRSAPSGPVQG